VPPRTFPASRHEAGQIALVLQGGGALGAYQAGVYEELYEAGIAHPEWLKSSGLDDGVTQYDLTRRSRQVDPRIEAKESGKESGKEPVHGKAPG
jgi:NTE family protein